MPSDEQNPYVPQFGGAQNQYGEYTTENLNLYSQNEGAGDNGGSYLGSD